MFHSAYGNSPLELTIYKDCIERIRLQNLIGEEAEKLVFLFCTIPRHHIFFEILLSVPDSELKIPEEGLKISSEPEIQLSRDILCKLIVLVMADLSEQYSNWQDDLFLNRDGKLSFGGNSPHILWPGIGKPGLWMNCVSRLGSLLRSTLSISSIPPIFNNCGKILSVEHERQARDMYWDIISNNNMMNSSDQEKAISTLLKCVILNPYIAEPHVLLSQLFLIQSDFQKAQFHSASALKLFYQWGTTYDKRNSWETWISW